MFSLFFVCIGVCIGGDDENKRERARERGREMRARESKEKWKDYCYCD